MLVHVITEAGVEHKAVAELPHLLAHRDDAVIWVDIPVCEPPQRQILHESFGFHPRALARLRGT